MTKKEAQNFALSKGALFKEVSAKRNEGVQDVFEQLVDEVRLGSLSKYTPLLAVNSDA